VLDAIALVDKSTPINAVLNRVKPSALSRYYGQYYYGGYGYGTAAWTNAEGGRMNSAFVTLGCSAP